MLEEEIKEPSGPAENIPAFDPHNPDDRSHLKPGQGTIRDPNTGKLCHSIEEFKKIEPVKEGE